MRLVQLSDIHLSKDNYDSFISEYREALLNDLFHYHSIEKINLIIITGDLVDKGGHSLLEIYEFKKRKIKNPFVIFEEVFINPIINKLKFNKKNILFVPGNHDVNEKDILWVDECNMTSSMNDHNIKEYLKENEKNLKYSKRLKNFKEFEKKFHEGNNEYIFGNNNSSYVYNYKENQKIGFLLINDSWRCKTQKLKIDKERHLFGSKQITDSLMNLKEDNTILNICLFHHSLNCFEEKEEVERLLMNKDIEIYLYGHSHNQKIEKKIMSTGNCYGIRCRSSFNKFDERDSIYIPGYHYIDLDIKLYKIKQIIYRKFNHNSCEFIPDVDSAPPDGIENNKPKMGIGHELYRKNYTPSALFLDKKQFQS